MYIKDLQERSDIVNCEQNDKQNFEFEQLSRQKYEQDYEEFVSNFTSKIYNLKTDTPFSDYIFLCVGSDKVTGDAFGPLVGKKLEELLQNYYNNIHIIGTLEKPIHANNLDKAVRRITKDYKNPCVIAIDSALSKEADIGKIFITNKEMKLANGIGKNTIDIGNISIKGVVAKNHRMSKQNFYELQNTSLNLVMKLADITSNGIYEVIKYK